MIFNLIIRNEFNNKEKMYASGALSVLDSDLVFFSDHGNGREMARLKEPKVNNASSNGIIFEGYEEKLNGKFVRVLWNIVPIIGD